ncbi:MAG: hypothetical protein COA42_03235 [Alteromonadaceae bacterium]|nr:MAG: hypothetical protein COA42_03235 [Alteromonadaceae bacterium]
MSKSPLVKSALFLWRHIQHVFLLAVFYLSACGTMDTIDDPDAGRVFLPESVSEVGPLLSAEALSDPAQGDLVVSDRVSGGASDSTSDSVIGHVESSEEPELKKPLSEMGQANKVKVSPAQAQGEPAESKVRLGASRAYVSEAKSADSVVEAAVEVVNVTSNASLYGQVALVGVKNAMPILSGMIITLTPSDGRTLPVLASGTRHIVDMEDKTYSPAYMALKKGDQVSFVNKDKIKHNVFSSSGKNAFDLGTYSAGLQRSVTFKRQGIVKIYCNIHSEMATFVAVDDNSLSVVANANGGYRFESVPAGTYQLRVWHLRGEMMHSVSLIAKEDKRVDLSFDVSQFNSVKHKNKFGKKYDKNAALFDDEFY